MKPLNLISFFSLFILIGLVVFLLFQDKTAQSQGAKITSGQYKVPSFLTVGKSYKCIASGRFLATYKVSKVDDGSGWFEATMTLSSSDVFNNPGIVTKRTQWFNLQRFDSCYETEEEKSNT